MRRPAERPANAGFTVRNLFKDKEVPCKTLSSAAPGAAQKTG